MVVVFISPKTPLKLKKKGGGRVGMGKKVFLDLKGYFVMIWGEYVIPPKTSFPLKCVWGGSVFLVGVIISPKIPLKLKNVVGGVLVWVK